MAEQQEQLEMEVDTDTEVVVEASEEQSDQENVEIVEEDQFDKAQSSTQKRIDRLTKNFVFAYSKDGREYNFRSNNNIYIPTTDSGWKILAKYKTLKGKKYPTEMLAVFNDGKSPRRLQRLTYVPKTGKLKLQVSKYIQGIDETAIYACKSFTPK